MYQHGGDIYTHENIIMDFSVNLNPLGMPQSVKRAIRMNLSDYETYPDYSCRKLRQKLSEKEGVDSEHILCGNGAAELIYDVVRAANPEKALILVPAFSEYEKALRSVNCHVDYFYLPKEQDYSLEEGDVFLRLLMQLEEKYDMLFLCNPNNPTGGILKQDLIVRMLRKCAAFGTRIVLDECFIDFTGEESLASQIVAYPNLVVIKAFTKIYSMAGIRLGYALCSDEKLRNRILSMRQCWNVSSIAQRAGVAALEENDYLERTRAYVQKERKYMEKQLIKLGFNTVKGVANYILFHTKSEQINLWEELYKKQILIRQCDDYIGLKMGYYRIAVRRHKENKQLIQAIREIQNK